MQVMNLRVIGICLAFLWFSALGDNLSGRVVKVADGDTITVLTGGSRSVATATARASLPPTEHKIRLHGIDAPEKDQAFGQKSKQRLSDYVFGKDVTVKWKSKDKYGRILGTVFVDGKDINLEMLKAGMAWHYKRFDKSPAYAAAEQDARENRRGLWIDPNPIPPEQFRHAVPSPSAAVPVGSRVPRDRIEYRAGNTLPVSARTPAPVNSTWPDTGYWLSTNSNKRHNRNCENYRKTRGYPCQKNEGDRCGKCGG